MTELDSPPKYTPSQQIAHDLMAPIRAAQTFVGFVVVDLDTGNAQSARDHAEKAHQALAETVDQLVEGLFPTETSPTET